jgi:hypothetical protein
MRSAMPRDALHAGVLDAPLREEQGQLMRQADGGGEAVGGREQGDPGQGEGREDGGTGTTGPAGPDRLLTAGVARSRAPSRGALPRLTASV